MSKAVEMKQVTKEFDGVIANDHIDFDVGVGEIHGLLGENGAGKTTLMNILYGIYSADEGEMHIHGHKVHSMSPGRAIQLGLGMVHQHFMLIAPLTVTENILIGLSSKKGFLDVKEAESKISELSQAYGLKVDPNAKIWQLSAGERQRVEILKTLYRGAKILILDEPTSVLTPHETNELFQTLRAMVSKGYSVVFITHKLNEVLSITDRITVLRNGKWVATLATKEATKEKLATMMVGRELLGPLVRTRRTKGRILIEVKQLCALKDNLTPALRGVTFGVSEGEILGIAGVAGNGQRELAEVIMGLRKATKGNVVFEGEDITNRPTRRISQKGLSYIPEDRINTGLVMDFTVGENAILGSQNNASFVKGPTHLLDYDAIYGYAADIVQEFDVRISGVRSQAKQLSGGNMQKLILARELSRNPKLLIACNPTNGLDVGATKYVRERFLEQRDKEKGLLLVSEDLDEVLELSDRIAVIYEGQIMGVVSAEDVKIGEIALMMAGSKEESGFQRVASE